MVYGEGRYGPERLTSDIPIWSHIKFGFAQNEWNNLDMPYVSKKVFKFRVAANSNCFHICGKNRINFKMPYYICGKKL